MIKKKFKIGDKVYCIKNRKNHITAGNFYKILKIHSRYIEIMSDNKNESSFYKKYRDKNYYAIEDYLITEKELRKQKMLKLCDCAI